MFENHVVDDVPGLGKVVFSRHAQDKATEHGVTEMKARHVLMKGEHIPDGQNTMWIEKGKIRLVVVLEPFGGGGIKLVTTLYRVEDQACARYG